jgi:8-oxo-dGTP pyrophosphatase MutT (NUDIX family)
VKEWELIESEYAFQCPWLKVRKDKVRVSNGIVIDDYYVVEASNWVNVIAVTEDGRIVMEKQYRQGIRKICYELPAGMVEQDEEPLDAAKRELAEETGYAGGDWHPFGRYAPNASGMNNVCYTFIAYGVRFHEQPHREITEDIHVSLMTEEEVRNLLETNEIIEAVMAAPLWRYINRKK